MADYIPLNRRRVRERIEAHVIKRKKISKKQRKKIYLEEKVKKFAERACGAEKKSNRYVIKDSSVNDSDELDSELSNSSYYDDFEDDSVTESRINTDLRKIYTESNKSLNIKRTSENHTQKSPSVSKNLKNINSNINDAISKNLNKESKKLPVVVEKSSVKFSDVYGLNETLIEILKLIVHFKKPEIHQHMGISPPRGLLLHGPSGCGKTLIAHAIAGQLDVSFIKVAATELVSGVSGESESTIRELFNEAINNTPCILFIDEIDAITPKRDTVQKEMEKRIVAQLLKCMDDLNAKEFVQLMVIGATNRPDSLDPALRRAGRFDHEISIGIPDDNSRLEILKAACSKLKLSPDFDIHCLVKSTPGYVGADLISLTGQAAMSAYNRIFSKLINENYKSEKFNKLSSINCKKHKQEEKFSTKGDTVNFETEVTLEAALSWLASPPLTEEQLKDIIIATQDFETVLKVYVPSSKREGFATIPNVTWNDVGALNDVKIILQKAILWPIKYKKQFSEFHISTSSGILLCGPKGCGKTLLAKAIANECSINFISVKGPELLNLYLGESERAIRQLFQRARNSFPCVIFIDEIDALCPPRSGSFENVATERVVNQLLTEMDGAEFGKPVFVLGATNRPENIDSAMLRPGRLEKVLFIDLPTATGRTDILRAITKNGTKPKLADDVNLTSLANDIRCESFTGADLKALISEASLQALEEFINLSEIDTQNCDYKVKLSHFEQAFLHIKPSVSKTDKEYFRSIKTKMFYHSL